MSREIKFRAWDTVHETMEIIDDLYWFEEQGVDTQSSDGLYHGHHTKYELMQYTGLKDKNGAESYEDDLWQAVSGGPKYLVQWTPGSAGFSLVCIETVGPSVGKILGMFHLRQGEVIGNIYEHPHLIKKDEA